MRVSQSRLPLLQEQINGITLHGQWLDATLQLTSTLGGGYHQA